MHEIKEDLKAIRTDLSVIKVDVAKNTVSLESHMARTVANEKRITYVERMLMGLTASAIIGGLIKIFTA